MNWFSRNWKPVALAVVGAAVAATAIFFTGSQGNLERPLLVGHTMGESAYRAAQGQGFLTPPAAATAWTHCKMNELSGDLQCRDQTGAYVTLTKNGTPTYQVRTPIPTDRASAQGRKGWNFGGAAAIAAPAAGTISLGTVTGFTLEVLLDLPSPASTAVIMTTRDIGTDATRGASLFYSATNIYCHVTGDGAAVQSTRAAWTPDGRVHLLTCAKTWSGAAWTGVIYLDGAALADTEIGASGANDLTSASAFAIGKNQGATPYYYTGTVYEAHVRTTDDSAATVLGRYRALLQTGAYASADASSLFLAKFNESVNTTLVDYSGGSRNLTVLTGSPTVQYGDLPYPAGGMWSRRGIWFNASNANFAGSAGVAVPTTGNASYSMILCPSAATANLRVFSNRDGANVGLEIYQDAADGSKLSVFVGDATTFTSGPVTAAGALKAGVCSHVTVNFNRAGNAYAFVDDLDTGVVVNISARTGTLTNANSSYLGRYGIAASLFYGGRISELMYANGLRTLAEHQAWYRAFKVPTSVSYTQTTTRKYPIPSEDGFGVRTGVYGGSATNPQWPIMYASGATTTGTDEVLGFPAYGPTTNVIGRVSELASWTASGATVSAESADTESPDGSVVANRITFSANGQYVQKAVVGGGTIAAGERWCASTYARRISGACTGINLYTQTGAAGSTTTFTDATTWARVSVCDGTAGATKGIRFHATTHGSCVLEVSDNQYEANNVTPPCTSTTGDVSQTCNAPLLSSSWASKSALMPTVLSRGEVKVYAVVEPWVYAPGLPRIAWHTGDESAYLAEAVEPVFVLKDEGGAPSAVVKHKPIRHEARAREYVASWDQSKAFGLTNTSPRKYASLSVDGTYGAHALSSRHTTSEAGQLDPVTPPTQKNYGSQTIYIGCPATNSTRQCLQGVIESWGWYARPEQKAKADDADLVLNGGLSGADFLRAQAIPRFECPAGLDTANCWIWDAADYSGSLYDRVNGVALAPTGSPRYQAWTGLLARGQGRRGVNFAGTAGSHYVQASSTAINQIGNNQAWTVAAIFNSNNASSWIGISTVNAVAPGTGYAVAKNVSAGRYRCIVYLDGANYRGMDSAVIPDGRHLVHCTGSMVAGSWVPHIYVDGALSDGSAVTAGAVATPINNSQPFTVGRNPVGLALSIDGTVEELYTRAALIDASTALSDYKRLVQTGLFQAPSSPVSHFKMNDAGSSGVLVNGVGLRDHSGNGNHLTVVTGTPGAQYRDMPWPAGTGLTKPGVEYVANTDIHQGGTSAANPTNNQSFSVIGWVRNDPSVAGNWNMFDKATANEAITVQIVNGVPYCYWTMQSGAWCAGHGTAINDGVPHLVACRFRWATDRWYPEVSIDGAAFGGNDTNCTGSSVGSNNANIQVGERVTGTSPIRSQSGLMLLKDYALSNSDVAAYYKAGASPLSTLTYARTNKACYEAGIDPVEGVRVRCFKAGDVGFIYDALAASEPGNMRLGLYAARNPAVQNLALQSEDATTTWTNNNTTDAANSAVAPDGSMTADTVTATAGAGDLRQAFASITAASHTYCQHLKRNGASDVAGFVRLVKNSDGTQIAQTAFTATAAWQRFCVTGTAVLNDTRIETQITTNGQSVYWWGASLTTSAWIGVYCPTTTGSYTCNAVSSAYVPAVSMTAWDRAQGTISVRAISNNATSYVLDLHNGSNANGALRVLSPTTEAYIYDASGALAQRWSATNAQTSLVTGHVLNFSATGDYFGTRQVFSTTLQSSYAGPWSTTTTDVGNWSAGAGTSLHLGGDNAGANLVGKFGGVYVWRTK